VLRRFAISALFLAGAMMAMARTRPHYGGTLRVEIAGDPWQRPDGIARRLVYDGLTELGPDGALRPALALTWESDGNNHRWQFRLRPGVQFHDGSALTSPAVVASLTASCSSDCPWTAVKAVGPLVVFTSDSPMPNLPALLAGDTFLIRLATPGDGNPPVNQGTGPFQVKGFINGLLTLTANEGCWQGRPFVDAVEIRAHRPVREQWLDLGVGRADVVEVPAEQLRQAQQQRLSLLTSPPLILVALQVADSGSLANVKLRGAIAAAVDRGALYNVIFQKQGEITASLLPQRLTGYSFLFPSGRDMNKAQELRGGLTSRPLTLATEGDGAMQLAAQRIALNLREAGFNVQMAPEGANYADLILRKLRVAGTDPAASLEQALRSAGESNLGTDARPMELFKVEQKYLSEQKLIPLLYLPLAYARGPRVREVHLRADGTPDLADVSLEDIR
jgi:peptide/nickel transport system substrate-binding protein